MEIKDLIKLKREELGLTFEELGRMVGVGKSTVRKWEIGMIENMRRDNIVALSKALNISPSILMGWEDIECTNSASKLSIKESTLLLEFNKLNNNGKTEAIKRVNELTEINKYITSVKPTMVADESLTYEAPITLAAHDDGLTNEEKAVMDERITKALKNIKR